MHRAWLPLACALAVIVAACGSAVAPEGATAPACSHDTPDPGVCSPLKSPV
jgi:hypothetical protein